MPVIVRDDSGNQLATSTIQLGANGHTSFTLVQQFPQTSGIPGTVEFDSLLLLQSACWGFAVLRRLHLQRCRPSRISSCISGIARNRRHLNVPVMTCYRKMSVLPPSLTSEWPAIHSELVNPSPLRGSDVYFFSPARASSAR